MAGGAWSFWTSGSSSARVLGGAAPFDGQPADARQELPLARACCHARRDPLPSLGRNRRQQQRSYKHTVQLPGHEQHRYTIG